MKTFYLNILLAILWLMLTNEPTLTDFFIGYLIGFIVLLPFSKLLKEQNYSRRVFAFLKFAIFFLKEFILSNLNVAYIILFVPKSKIKPTFFDFDTKDLNFFETITLSYCITLTPGTISVKIMSDKHNLVVHCLDSRNLEKTKSKIESTFKQNIVGFTR